MAKPSRTRRWLKISIVAAVAVSSGLFLFLVWAASLADVAALAESDPVTTAFIERNRAKGVNVRWRMVPMDEISVDLKQAVIVAEDIGFFDHDGFDTTEMATAVRDAMDGKKLRGASTITQQLAKNLWLSPEKTATRKLKEAVLTWRLERHLSKSRILELYLNVVEFAPGVFGVDAAAEEFFGSPASEIDAGQAAQLAAGLSRPSLWNPDSDSAAYWRHVERIRGRMDRAEWLLKKF
jgi:monofunctional biosynthetic peptidoglycan transglycosylase